MNPAVLETIKTVAGIANAERIEKANRDKANEILEILLTVVKKDSTEYSLRTNGISLNP